MVIQEIISEITETKDTLQSIIENSSLLSTVEEIATVATNVIKNGNKIMFCGNGGSAADSQHLAAEFVSRLYVERQALPAIALTTDTSIITAISNDYGYENLFARQVQGLGKRGDMLIGISTSGKSLNVINGIIEAKKSGIITVGFLGQNGNEIGKLVDYELNIPSHKTPKIQEAHITLGHIFCKIVEHNLFGVSAKKTIHAEVEKI